jgi:hypothetical protein
MMLAYVAVTLALFTSYAFGQEPMTNKPQPQKDPVEHNQPPRPHNQPAAAPKSVSNEICFYAGKEYSVGATFCLSSQLATSCQGRDDAHPWNWWMQYQQALCKTSTPTNSISTP